jgi:TMEM175 potassium channel family protein
MTKNRLEAFSDGVIAILITIMVLELKVPHGAGFAALRPMWPVFLAYLMSFVVLAIYWNNHHHMLHATRHVTGGVLWANVHLLFWLSLIPFATAWMGESGFAPFPTAAYGAVLLFSGVAYYVLQSTIIAHHGMAPEVAELLRGDVKGRLSVALYAAAVPLAFVHRAIAGAIYAAVALMWLVPDRRIERALRH